MFNGRTLLRALLGAALLTSLTLSPTAQADPPLVGNKPCANLAPQAGATKFLIAGDSIVHESRGDYTWRYFLYQQLVAAGVNTDFVGDYNWLIDPVSSKWPYCDYADPAFDSDHTSTPGRKLADYNVVGDTPGGVPYIRYEVATHQADVLVMLAGANDLAKGASASATLTEAQNLVGNARLANPNVKVVLVATPTGGPYNSKPNPTYNALLKDQAPGWSTPSSPVVVADPMTSWGTAERTWDEIHPNVVGEQLIASGIADSLHDLGIGADGVALNPAFKVGLRQPVTGVTAVLDGSELDLSWTLPVGASGVQIMARRTTGGDVGEWFLLKDMPWAPFTPSQGCTNPDYQPNPFDPAYDPNQTIPCTQTTVTSGLISGHSYDVALHAAKGSAIATDLFSNIQSFTMPGEIPTPPAVPVVQAPVAAVNAVTLTWAAASGANQPYDVRYRAGAGSWSTTTATGTSKTVSGLTAGQTYGFQVRASKDGVPSDWSAEQIATPVPATPVPTATAGVNAATVSWAAVTGADSYNLRWRVGTGAFTTQVVTGTSTTVAGLQPGLSHGFSVQADASGTTGAWSAEKVATPIPAAPVLGSAVAAVRGASLSWGAVPGVTGYAVSWRTGAGAWSTSNVAAPTSRTISGLVAGVRYEVKVKAVAGGTSSAWSASRFVTAKASVISALAKPVLKKIAGPKVKVTWRKATGATRYLLQFHQVGQPWRNVGWFTTQAATSARLKKKKSYEWRVVPYDGNVAGKVSPTARITVK